MKLVTIVLLCSIVHKIQHSSQRVPLLEMYLLNSSKIKTFGSWLLHPMQVTLFLWKSSTSSQLKIQQLRSRQSYSREAHLVLRVLQESLKLWMITEIDNQMSMISDGVSLITELVSLRKKQFKFWITLIVTRMAQLVTMNSFVSSRET